MKKFFVILISILLIVLMTLSIMIFSKETDLSLEEGKKAIQLLVKQENLKYDAKNDWYVSDNYVDPFVFKYEKYKPELYKVIFYRKTLSAKPSCYCMVNIKTGQIQGQFSMDDDYEVFYHVYKKKETMKELKNKCKLRVL